MKIYHLILPSILVFSSCAHMGRKLASGPISPPELSDLLQASEDILVDVEDHQFPKNCVPYLKELEKRIDALDVKSLPVSTLSADAEKITKNSWLIRSALHARLAEVDKDCAIQMQSSFRQFRFVEDYLLEQSRKVSHLTPKDVDFQNQPIPIWDNSVPFYEFRSQNSPKLEPGDLLITRGLSFLSGMIARLGTRATQFSHVVMVAEDPKTKELRTIESYVGVGVAFYNMDYALKNENVRILWLRARDRNLARTAASQMSKLLQDRNDSKDPIKYDYELNFSDPKAMSCAEVSYVAFLMASRNQFKLPYYPNEIAGARSIIERLKLEEGETYTPGDMEIDPRFELMGEFQDLRLTRDSRQKDAIMTALFDWMVKKDYELKDNMKSRMAGTVIYNIRRTFMWPMVKKLLKLDDFSKEVPRNMIRTVAILNQLGENLLIELKARDLAYEKKYGVPMSYMDFYRELEDMRISDLELYKKDKKKSKIHKFIRPRK